MIKEGYAQRLIISDPSPSGRFNIVKACEGTTNESGLCWSVYLVDRQAETAQKVDIAKYGGLNWVQWTADERYALFAESMEGVSWFVALDLQTKEAKMFEQTAATADLSSFKWTGSSCGVALIAPLKRILSVVMGRTVQNLRFAAISRRCSLNSLHCRRFRPGEFAG